MDGLIYYPTISNDEKLKTYFLKRIGCHSERTLSSAKVLDIAHDAWKKCLETATPKAIVRLTQVEEIKEDNIYAQGISIESSLWAGLAKNASNPLTLAVFALTLGSNLSQETLNAQKHSLSESYILHEAGSIIIENAADHLETMIREIPDLKNLTSSRRFSPGYCDIPLLNQNAFFQFLVPETIGIQMMGSGGMRPEKSITAAMLFSNRLPDIFPCLDCRNDKCQHRRGKRKETGP
ncbi:MAG: hypothetical protein KJ737_07930 [Proteobacteria bacterium]|nr:hypothetical protein [Pseudomonadota bacterium]